MSEGPSMREVLREHVELARTLRRIEIHFDPEVCKGVWQCYEVCPIGCWIPDYDERVVEFHHGEHCIACSACVLQCPEGAIELRIPDA